MEKFKSAIASFFDGDSVPLRLCPLLGLSISFAVLFLGYGFSLSGIEVEKLWIFNRSTQYTFRRFETDEVFRGEIFFQNLQNQDMTTTEGFASVRESVTSRDAEVTAQRLDFQYVVLFSFFFYD